MAQAVRSGGRTGARHLVSAAERQGRSHHCWARGSGDRCQPTACRHLGARGRCSAARLRRVRQQGAGTARPGAAGGTGRDPFAAQTRLHGRRRHRRGIGAGPWHRPLDGGDDVDVPPRPSGPFAHRRPGRAQGRPARGQTSADADAEGTCRARRALGPVPHLRCVLPVEDRRLQHCREGADTAFAGISGHAAHCLRTRHQAGHQRQCQGS